MIRLKTCGRCLKNSKFSLKLEKKWRKKYTGSSRSQGAEGGQGVQGGQGKAILKKKKFLTYAVSVESGRHGR